jgi:hypothetical protein
MIEDHQGLGSMMRLEREEIRDSTDIIDPSDSLSMVDDALRHETKCEM